MAATKVMVDTNVVSYIMKGTKEAKAYVKHIDNRLVAVSFVTVGELYYGAENRNWGMEKRKMLENAIRNYVVVPYDHEIAKTFGKIVVERQRQGLPISFHDAWIAACAVRHGVPIVTHNAKDFVNISGLKVITEQ